MDELLDQDIPQWLSEPAKENFLNLRSMFESDGWKLVMDLAGTKANEALLLLAEAKTWEQNRVYYGQRQIWIGLSELETRITNEFRGLAFQNRLLASDESDAEAPDLRHE
jgi:hypothetical protein